ncbi:MAG: chorismate-binding protein [Desulfocapsaceae bacterium]|nr:chorismate-binding protein [Desulfocapsaceae bacterium]
MDTMIDTLLTGDTAFCLIQKQDSEEILILTGNPYLFERISDIPRRFGQTGAGRIYDTISVIPFCSIQEKGYSARDEGEKIRTISVTAHNTVVVADLIRAIPELWPVMKKDIRYDTTEAQYAEIIRNIIVKEIGNGEGANFVIARNATGGIDNFSLGHALTIFKSLLQYDYGTYWKFLFYDGSLCFIGSTPERHLLVEAGRVNMNPISGTFRKERNSNRARFKKDLLAFLRNPKEINELFMVVDEELKMMARMCRQGGAIVGPLLKEMSRLIHTEYLLSGTSDKDIFDLFIDSMFAATVVGSPVENACRIIEKYSENSRRYYGGALMLVGRDEQGRDFLDSPITIRTAEIAMDGTLHLSVGATLVKDSVPEDEVRETLAKAGALISSISGSPQPVRQPALPKITNEDEIAQTLAERNKHLSSFWFFRQDHPVATPKNGQAARITLIDNEDDFIHMLSHIFTAIGLKSSIVSYRDYDMEKDRGDITLVGPGPGNPNDTASKKIMKILAITTSLVTGKRKGLFICLGHQILCRTLGLEIKRKEVPFQGSQIRINLFGKDEMVGFYNTFAPQVPQAKGNFEIATIPELQELIAIRGEHFAGFQFHPESILTRNGVAILQEAVNRLLASSLPKA